MDEYANIRLIFVCTNAAILPTVIVNTARIAKTSCQSNAPGGTTMTKARKNAAKAAAFVATLIKAVTGVGAPSYTSGIHHWNGTSPTLNPKPTSNNPPPTTNNKLLVAP